MTACTHCGEEREAEFDVCWNCGWSREGSPPVEFVREPLPSDTVATVSNESAARLPVPSVDLDDPNTPTRAMLRELVRTSRNQDRRTRRIGLQVGCLFAALVFFVVVAAAFYLFGTVTVSFH